MKKLHSLILGLVFVTAYSQTTVLPSGLTNLATENYVYSRAYLDPVTASSATAKQAQTVTYFDGLGRPKQTIQIKGGKTPNSDLVTPVIYDCFGRQVRDYLPIPQISSIDGGIYPQSSDCSTDGNAFPISDATGFYQGEKIYSKKVLESSPLDRIQQQIQPGSDWQSHPVNFGYQTNEETEVLKFTTTTSSGGGAFYTGMLSVNGYYDASTLYKNKVSDEDGNTTYEFKNGEGQTLLLRKVIGGVSVDPIATEGIVAQIAINQYADTYYIYNEYNQLAFVISPLASEYFKANNTQSISNPKTLPNLILDNLCYQYNYDGRNRLVEKKLPGKGWESMVYDKADRLIMTQDSMLASNDNTFGAQGWLFTKYDQFSRVVYTGFTSNTDDRATIQNSIDTNTAAVYHESRSSTIIINSGTNLYYTNTVYPTIVSKLLSVNYYDSYPSGTPFPANNTIQGESILLASYDTLGRSTKSLPLATMVKNINDDKWTKNYSYYDGRGRVIGTTSINYLNGRTRVEMKLDFAGVVTHSDTWHNKKAGEQPIHIIEDFFYDHQNRLTKHYHEVEGKTPKELLADNTYDALGRLETKKVGARSDANFAEVLAPLQTIQYNYNIRGWMTGINLSNDGKLDMSKLFSYKIKYNDPAKTAIRKYNGNISEVDWAYGSNNYNRYEYTYDNLNRLRKGNYKTFNETTTTDSKYYNEELTYDTNGNIKTLKRNARPRTGTTATQVDNLIYYYENNQLSNRLERITDNEGAVANPSGYPGGGAFNTYDSNGNMLTMPDKGITQNITYNHLNLPQVIVKNGQPMTYTYRADGEKVYKKFEVNGQNIETWYLDGFVYTTPYTPDLIAALQKTPASEEMSLASQREAFELADKVIIVDPGPTLPAVQSSPNFFATSEGFYDYENFRYIYQYKDHLGNTRLNYGRNSEGDLFTEDSNDYYPFGLNFINNIAISPVQVYNPSATYQNYKYNGKELQETGMYAMDFRHYMPDIGRFTGMDLLSELRYDLTPYRFGNNNPIFYKDPTGLYEVDSNGNIKITNAGEISNFMSYLNHNSGASVNNMFSYITNPDNGFAQDLPGVVMTVQRGGNTKSAWQNAGNTILSQQQQAANNLSLFNGNVSILGHDLNSFDKGFLEADKSNFMSGSAWAGYTGLNLEKYNALLKTTFRQEQSFSSLKYVAKTLKNVEIAGKALGWAGVGLSVIEDYKENKLGWGTGAKVAIGAACIYLGPVGVAYSIVDLSVGAATGTTLTDRIAEGVDEAMK